MARKVTRPKKAGAQKPRRHSAAAPPDRPGQVSSTGHGLAVDLPEVGAGAAARHQVEQLMSIDDATIAGAFDACPLLRRLRDLTMAGDPEARCGRAAFVTPPGQPLTPEELELLRDRDAALLQVLLVPKEGRPDTSGLRETLLADDPVERSGAILPVLALYLSLPLARPAVPAWVDGEAAAAADAERADVEDVLRQVGIYGRAELPLVLDRDADTPAGLAEARLLVAAGLFDADHGHAVTLPLALRPPYLAALQMNVTHRSTPR